MFTYKYERNIMGQLFVKVEDTENEFVSYIPAEETNRDYRKIIEDGVEIEPED